MKREALTILFPGGEKVSWCVVPEETLHDLGLDAILEKLTRIEKEQTLIRQIMARMTPDPAVAKFRCEVFDDLYRNPEIRRKLMELLDHVKFLNDYGAVRRPSEEAAGLWDLLHRLDEISDYITTVEAIGECLQDAKLASEGLSRLREGILEIWQDSGFDALKRDISALKADTQSLKSITVGLNLNERMEAVSAGLISVNSKPFTRSGILRTFSEALSRRDQIRDSEEWNGEMNWHPAASTLEKIFNTAETVSTRVAAVRNPLMAMTLASIPTEDGTRELPRTMDAALGNLVSSLVRKLREVLSRYATVSIHEMTDLIPELIYYIRWAEYIEKLRGDGWRFTRAEPCSPQEKGPRMEARNFYNLKLTLTEPPDRVVPNDLDFSAEKRLYLLTGANRGGKTTVTQAVGQMFLLAQGGIYVPAEEFVFTPADLILTHFPADEDRTLDLGRLGEECSRFRDLYARCTGDSLLLLNETFSTTSFEEGYYIAADAVRAILRRGARTIYNTHMHKLARDLDSLNEGAEEARAFSLIVRSGGGERSFRIAVAPPEGMSYARDIAEKYGVTFDALTAGEGSSDSQRTESGQQ